MNSCVVFRVDASLVIGSGHVVRCLVLADQLRPHGLRSRFVCRAHDGHLADLIRGRGHEVALLPPSPAPMASKCADGPIHEDWLGAPWDADVDDTVRAIADLAPAWLIVDHFGIGQRWERRFRERLGAQILVIDGQARHAHDCDLLLDASGTLAGPARWDGLLPVACQRLVGPGHALLRPEFEQARRDMPPRKVKLERILVSFGGMDAPNATAVALRALASLDLSDLSIDVAVGAGNPHRQGLERQCAALPRTALHVQTERMATLMADADLAISAGGTVVLEQCAMGLPAIVLSIADNQVASAQAFAARGALVYAGAFEPARAEHAQQAIAHQVQQLRQRPDALQRMQAAACALMSRPGRSAAEVLLDSCHETV